MEIHKRHRFWNNARKWGAGLLAAAILVPATLQADELYALSWVGTEYRQTSSGIVSRPFSQKKFITEVANNHSIPASDLVLVYRPLKRDISMVRRDGRFVASIIQMEYVYTDVSTPSGNSTVRQTFLYDEYHDGTIGTAFGRERITRNSKGDIKAYLFSGKFNYAYPEDGALFSGTFTTGRKIVDKSGN